MDCKIRNYNRGLYCDTHRTTSMSLLCGEAEQQLRDTITQLQKTVAILQEQLQDALESLQ
jgi:CMP-N-acetylneuraminic acid synthetase